VNELPAVNNIWRESNTKQTRERPIRLSPVPLIQMVEGMPCREAAAMLGVNAGTLQKWRNGETQQGLHYARADRIACQSLGVHPTAIWGKDWWLV
jgi:hypothetical protein